MLRLVVRGVGHAGREGVGPWTYVIWRSSDLQSFLMYLPIRRVWRESRAIYRARTRRLQDNVSPFPGAQSSLGTVSFHSRVVEIVGCRARDGLGWGVVMSAPTETHLSTVIKCAVESVGCRAWGLISPSLHPFPRTHLQSRLMRSRMHWVDRVIFTWSRCI